MCGFLGQPIINEVESEVGELGRIRRVITGMDYGNGEAFGVEESGKMQHWRYMPLEG